MFKELFTEATEWVTYDITNPKDFVEFGNYHGHDKFIPFKSKMDARKAQPRDNEDWVVVTKEEYDKIIKKGK